MSLPLLIAIFTTLFFGILAISSSIREDKNRKRIAELEDELNNREFEEQLITEIHNHLDHSLDINKITGVITQNLSSFFTYSTVSTLILEDHKLAFKVKSYEPVSHKYVDKLKELMLHSLAALEKRSFYDAVVTEDIAGHISAEAPDATIASHFHMPIMIHDSVAAIITITSTQPDQFPAHTKASLQRIIKHAARTINKLDAALQVEKGRLTAMIESLNDGLFMVDTHNNLQVINPTAKHVLGVHKQHPTTMDVLSSLPINYDFGSKIKAALYERVTTTMAGVAIKNKLLSFTIAPVTDTAGKLLGASVILHDDTLKNSVPRMKEDFTNILVHELRSPLTSIRASSQLLTSGVQFSSEEQKKLANVIYQQADKLLSEIQQILDAAKLEAGVFLLDKKPHDLKQVINEVAAAFQPEAQQKMINFIINADPRLPAFSFDAHHISRALTNVLSNSFKFTSTGGTVQINVKEKEGKAVITISDTGAGIPKDKQHQLFNKFSQITDANANVGTGLGLYLVKGVFEAHGGTVALDSEHGRGTTLTLTLPIVDMARLPFSLNVKPHDPHKIVN